MGACAVGAGFSFIGACAVGAGASLAGACAVGAGFMGACAFGAGDFCCGTVLGCWSVLPPGAFGSWVAPGASRFSPGPCAEAKPAPAMSAVAATVASKVCLMVFFIEISNKSDCSSTITRQIVFTFQVLAKIYTV